MAPEAMLVINELSSQHNEAEQTKPRFSLIAEIAWVWPFNKVLKKTTYIEPPLL